MILTAEQLRAIQQGEPVAITVGQTECVVVRKDCFREMQPPTYDDSDWSEEELSLLAERMFDDLDRAEKVP